MRGSDSILQLPATLALIASVALVSVVAWSYRPLFAALALDPWRVVRRREVYRLLTAGWLHADFTHLAFNMLTLYFFAGRVSAVLGDPRFVALYVSAVVAAHIPTTLRYKSKTNYRSVGASGAVAAVMFSAILLDPHIQLYILFIPFPVPGFVFGIGYLVYSAWLSQRSSDNINHDAHFWGAAYGAGLTFFMEPARVERSLAVIRQMIGA